ncbi:MAG: FadR family transcriptional regulator [Acidobacteria bacterium]|nr:MAG: FadR family transcriptional regulator [Acidobacteriota bacterium]
MAKRIKPAVGKSIGMKRSDETFRQIVALIFEGHFSPGSPLPPERELAETLNVSRPTLREALNRLEAKGFIDRRSKSGNYVCTSIPTSVSEPIHEVLENNLMPLTDIIDIRKILEVWAVEMAITSPNKARLLDLAACVDAMGAEVSCESDEQFARYRAADQRFHQLLAEMTGNLLYVHLAHFLSDLVCRSISMSRRIFPGDYPRNNLRRHEQILEALRERDLEQAKKAMLEHFHQIERYLSRGRSQPLTAKPRLAVSR